MSMTVQEALSIANGITYAMNSCTGVNVAVVTLAEEVGRLQAIVNTLPLNGSGDRITLGSKQWLRLGDCWVQTMVFGVSKPEIRVGHGGDDYRDYVEYAGPKALFTKEPKDE